MSGVSIFNYNQYRDEIKKTNVAQDVALTIRQAQVYGIASSDRNIGNEELDTGTNADDLFGFNDEISNIADDRAVRGVYIEPASNSMIIFEDINRNFVYQSGGDRVIDERSVIASGISISGIDLCDNAPNCGNIVTDPVLIAFQRPYSEAFISINGNPSTTFDFASILVNDGSVSFYVEVTAAGRIIAKREYE
tara:strand:- start:972 stop:1550 length:579 start_codon:yes stop_codon:yes gene_type:complete